MIFAITSLAVALVFCLFWIISLKGDVSVHKKNAEYYRNEAKKALEKINAVEDAEKSLEEAAKTLTEIYMSEMAEEYVDYKRTFLNKPITHYIPYVKKGLTEKEQQLVDNKIDNHKVDYSKIPDKEDRVVDSTGKTIYPIDSALVHGRVVAKIEKTWKNKTV